MLAKLISKHGKLREKADRLYLRIHSVLAEAVREVVNQHNSNGEGNFIITDYHVGMFPGHGKVESIGITLEGLAHRDNQRAVKEETLSSKDMDSFEALLKIGAQRKLGLGRKYKVWIRVHPGFFHK